MSGVCSGLAVERTFPVVNRTPAQVDVIRQIRATLAIEGLSVSESALSMMKRMAAGEVTYDDAIADLKRKYRNDEKY